jgi:RNA polymerase sigma-70 factor (ECF subfamily)
MTEPKTATRGDRALVDFCEREYPRLVGAISLYCGERALAEEFAQEALARLCRDWHKVARMQAPRAWLHRVAVNVAHSHFRRVVAERKMRTRAQEHVAVQMERPEDVDVRRAVAALPERQKTALVLRYFLDMPVTEVALVMQCPDSTVKSLTRRALQRLSSSPELQELQEVRDGV